MYSSGIVSAKSDMRRPNQEAAGVCCVIVPRFLAGALLKASLRIIVRPHWSGLTWRTTPEYQRTDEGGSSRTRCFAEACDWRYPESTRFGPFSFSFGAMRLVSRNSRTASSSSACTRRPAQLSDETMLVRWTLHPEQKPCYPQSMRLNGRRDRDWRPRRSG